MAMKKNYKTLAACEKCGKPTKIEVMFFGEPKAVDCICECRKKELEAKKKKMAENERQAEMMRLRKVGFPDNELAKCNFDMDDGANPALSEIAKRYVKNFDRIYDEGKGLLMYGGVGGGKSFMAACIANALIDKGKSCMMTNFARIANELSENFNKRQSYLDNLNRFSLLIIDDLAAERDTEYMGEIVQEVIDSRYRSGKPLIVTTNLTGEELNHSDGIRRKRVVSRLLEMCFFFQVDIGKDRRRQVFKQNKKLRIELLGM